MRESESQRAPNPGSYRSDDHDPFRRPLPARGMIALSSIDPSEFFLPMGNKPVVLCEQGFNTNAGTHNPGRQ
jgi:hypothetical protein